MHLLITLQSHIKSNNPGQPPSDRYPKGTREEISKRSLISLVNSINHLLSTKPLAKVELHVIDDRSPQHHIDFIAETLSKQKFKSQLIHLQTPGLQSSIKAVYKNFQTNGKELLYFAQDDYLFYPSALYEMVDSYYKFSQNTGKSVIIYPFDDPYMYQPVNLLQHRIVLGNHRHWRTQNGGSCAYLFDRDTLIRNFDLYQKFWEHPLDHDCEINTINRLFTERGYLEFTPIPTLAYHMQFESERVPFADFETLWKESEAV